MTQVLVLVELVDGALDSSTSELLAAAAQLGEPAAVVVVEPAAAAALAAALGGRDFDLVITGNESTDGRSAAVPAMLAERLGVAQLTFLRTLTVSAGAGSAGTVTGERVTAEGHVELRAALPALVSVTEQIAEARYPNFKGIMSAKQRAVLP